MTTTVLGYPRIGADRELKRATESFWAGGIDAPALDAVGARLRRTVWEALRDAGIAHIPSNTFSYYDHVLDTAVLFDAVPPRFAGVAAGRDGREAELARYFAMARGADDVPPLEMTKWFDTNYHYLVPELSPATRPRLAGRKPLSEYCQARGLGMETRPVLVGPLTFLLLAKPAADAPPGWRPLELLDDLLACYAALLDELGAAGAGWVQLDEPILATDAGRAALPELERAYARLGRVAGRPRLLVQTYFGSIGPDAVAALKRTAVEAIGLDLVTAPDSLRDLAAVSGLGERTLVAGVVDGRNVWRTDVPAALSTLTSLLGLAGEVVVSTSCSLLHVPIDLDAETGLDPALRERLAFARQKADEVVLLGRRLAGGEQAPGAGAGWTRAAAPVPASFVDQRVRARLDALGDAAERVDHEQRSAARAGSAASAAPPLLPTTTIGSFPQTDEVRAARAAHRAGGIDRTEYERRMRAEIDRVIALQEDIGLDVLVHGEPERNDMVQYFAEQLAGYASTRHGWVQSYGSRCVRPPILFGDVSRPEPMTVEWTTYAQSRTARPVKGMLTGPVTMLAWSFVRDDQPPAETARQVALALRDEVADLERAGIRHIQVDEAALRESLPLREEDRADYLTWAVGAFRLATSGVGTTTWIHSHMCYSEFGRIVGAIDALDADVTSVEAARSHMELVEDLAAAGYRRGIGPGVYDIHSPRVPSVAEIEASLRAALRAVRSDRLWVNPDCGLKTRGYAEVEPALRNMVEAARRVRADLAAD
ncbi:5-methyltetrahydropteroyltriglutamate--homocysteine methyltransferase [Spinactinospora alkalitolerans]|uniref:5-methyltetrahydropteroyltriglutamate--homocysteine methyltransferase n=1 Tax=Spinactinospora alkalitolerans TaxID=687207 RepID=A0A852U1Q2_9ACTN|nr:5-methyltetrahydropteroyltriglutamate--homocysteine S-methyltransferase [Spinactinospora alkalitolerans]NYE48903.1 5-methyltetrahydropteroyltriglutamate--homocysteine methyltransferase [Spinactinospora alkalitolerans]